MTQAGFTISGSAHPICPVMLGDARLASLMADDMLKLGNNLFYSIITFISYFLSTFHIFLDLPPNPA